MDTLSIHGEFETDEQGKVIVWDANMQALWAFCRAQEGLVSDSYERLTPREREALQLIAEEHTTREIAQLLDVSPKTVETHRGHLMKKLGIHTPAGLTRYAIRRGIVGLDR